MNWRAFYKSLDKDGREGARAFFLEAWNGDGRFTFDRIGRGTLDIAAAIVSIIGAIQPGPLSEYVTRQESGGTGDDGLLQRFQLAVWPDASQNWRNIDRFPDTEARQRAWHTYERLNELEAVTLSAERDKDEHVPYLRFSETAQERFDEWRGTLELRVRNGSEHPAVESHLSKYRSLVPSLALLTHLADEPDGGSISEIALEKAILWVDYLESHARRIYGSIASSGLNAAHRLISHLRAGDLSDGFSARDVYRKGWSGLTTSKQAKLALEILVDYGWVRAEELQTDTKSATIYRLNPLLKSRRQN